MKTQIRASLDSYTYEGLIQYENSLFDRLLGVHQPEEMRIKLLDMIDEVKLMKKNRKKYS